MIGKFNRIRTLVMFFGLTLFAVLAVGSTDSVR